jgi:hypothetical protein
MNTPRTKPPTRYSSAKIADVPEGWYSSGIVNADFAGMIGMIITNWPHGEEHMVGLFGELAGIADGGTARLIFRTIISQRTRVDIMEALLERSPIHKDKSLSFEEIITEFMSLNGIRNGYAHGLWYTHEDRKRVFLEEETDTYDKFLDKREVTVRELGDVSKRMMALMGRLMDRQRSTLLSDALMQAFSQKPSEPSSGNDHEKPPRETK